MNEHQLEVKRTARYFTLGTLNNQTKTIWFVLHGYGQLAQFFIKKFEVLNNESTFIVAPEALSRFYLQGVSGRVGATWMTKEARAAEIDDYIFYLNHLYDTLLHDRDLSGITIHVLGFSQGNATLLRWLNNGHIRYDRVVIWAGFFGNGVADVIDPVRLAHTPTALVYGTQDEYLMQIDLEKYETDIKAAIPHVQVVTFEGKHTIDVDTLKKIAL
ncbi:alpha/beta hydrolase [Runella slithyformis]|uniref:Phospholipase/Carboxylesterase n=1 Tax=Runella slithyformis (strain ATCC 29530 / DSM 19594 / LMG 11500 / NCIMB 11436 / LSU 4) TaxID=761193 RepID=A0A7U3ZNB4_RUNSL|nr:phospholipase [Runella slithyformis]AEI50370.1 phospholipase/Carboxylesterase [Runella slithyformis DSM 19594]